MSQQRAKVRLPGFKGPCFPSNIAKLNSMFSDIKNHDRAIRFLKKGLRGCLEIKRQLILTADMYRWFAAAHFDVNGVEVICLFPCCRDRKKGDGTTTDRSIAFYRRSRVPKGEMDGLARMIYLSLHWKHLEEVISMIRKDLWS